MNNKFAPKNFFDLSVISFADIFENIENVWEVLPKIKSYAESKSSGKPLIGKGTVIKDNVVFEGPCIIGDNCTIGPNAYFREGVIIGDNVKIGFGCEIKNSIILNDTKIPHLSYIGDSVVGNNINIAGGVMCANYRFDGRTILIRDGDKKIDTKLQKLGCIIGDKSQIGINSSTNPGTILGKNSIVWPHVLVFGVHKDSEVIK